MPCNAPLKGWYAKSLNDNGKRGIVFNPSNANIDMPLEVPCGQCWLCRLERSRQWALRCLDEAMLHKKNCFITLTYDSDHLPKNCSLDKSHFQKFMKRLRKHYAPTKIRFFHCGEYGRNDPQNRKHLQEYGISPLGRPHYHALLFGIDFDDKILLKSEDGYNLYHSPTLQTIWPFGYNTVAELSFNTAAYTARYIVKKQTGEKAEDHYKRLNPTTGELVSIECEYTTMSRRPGIGAGFFQKFKSDMYPKDFVTVRGKKMKPAKYYDKLLELDDPDLLLQIKNKRIKLALENKEDNTLQRLSSKTKVSKAKYNLNPKKMDGM